MEDLDASLPKLRAELQLLAGTPDPSGAARWLIYDPFRNVFIQIDKQTYQVLAHWVECETLEDLRRVVSTEEGFDLSAADVEALVSFLFRNKLTSEPETFGWRTYAAEFDAQSQLIFPLVLQKHLFFRVPLVSPQAFLQRFLPVAQIVASRPAFWLIMFLGGVGVYLASRQWDTYLATFDTFFTPTGWFVTVVVLAIVKIAHELGHAFTAVRYGARVSTMGVAFMLFMPLLYTDVTDAWRIRQRSKRFRIDSAGVRVELSIAAVSLFLWAFLPDGIWRSLAFVLSAVTLISSLIINLNPFLRFDGYYLLSEAIGIENMQERAFSLLRWRLREWLFRFGDPPPEKFTPTRQRGLIMYALATWLYRLFLFFGIALFVYHFCFKVLGVALFVLEIYLLILRPVMMEMKIWIARRANILASRRSWLTLAGILAVVAILVLPWSSRVEVPAILEFEQAQSIYPPRDSQIIELLVRRGEVVTAGQPLIRLSAPELEQSLQQTKYRLRLARMQYARRGTNPDDLNASIIREQKIAALLRQFSGLQQEISELIIMAPISGRVIELAPDLHAGRWVSRGEPMMMVAASSTFVSRGYVKESDLWRIQVGSKGVFIPDFVARSKFNVVVSALGLDAQSNLEIADLATPYGGHVAATLDHDSNIVPRVAQYLLYMRAVNPGGPTPLALRGLVILEGRAESLLARFWRQTLKVVMRETGA